MENRWELGNCFRTFEEAEEALEIKKIDTELRRYALEHNEEDIDWENPQTIKYYMEFDCENKRIYYSTRYYTKFPNQIYFTSEKIAEAAIEAIGREKVEKWARY